MIDKIEKLIKKKTRQLGRATTSREKYDKKYLHNVSNFTFFGGWNLGHVEGRISELEEQIDDLQELLECIKIKGDDANGSNSN